MSLKGNLQSIASAVVIGGSVAFLAIAGICESIPNWRFINYYHRALGFYADTSGNGKIEPTEEAKFIDDFNTEIRKISGYEEFSLKQDDIHKSSIDSRKILSLMQKYRPVPTF